MYVMVPSLHFLRFYLLYFLRHSIDFLESSRTRQYSFLTLIRVTINFSYHLFVVYCVIFVQTVGVSKVYRPRHQLSIIFFSQLTELMYRLIMTKRPICVFVWRLCMYMYINKWMSFILLEICIVYIFSHTYSHWVLHW